MTGAMRWAISWTRRVAPEHQCLSHMSQITMAVCDTGSTRMSAAPRVRTGRRMSPQQAVPAQIRAIIRNRMEALRGTPPDVRALFLIDFPGVAGQFRQPYDHQVLIEILAAFHHVLQVQS